jgi:hypothetical protein
MDTFSGRTDATREDEREARIRVHRQLQDPPNVLQAEEDRQGVYSSMSFILISSRSFTRYVRSLLSSSLRVLDSPPLLFLYGSILYCHLFDSFLLLLTTTTVFLQPIPIDKLVKCKMQCVVTSRSSTFIGPFLFLCTYLTLTHDFFFSINRTCSSTSCPHIGLLVSAPLCVAFPLPVFIPLTRQRTDIPLVIFRRDNLEFMQWIKRFWEQNYPGHEYDPVARRRGVPIEPPATMAPLRSTGSSSVLSGSNGGAVRGKTPVGGARRPMSATPNAELAALHAQVKELSIHMEGLEKERDFYFAKVRVGSTAMLRSVHV